MRILTAAQMRAADAATFASIGVPSRSVMECAGREVAALLLDSFDTEILNGAVVVCGAGNNGGDGYVCARALLNLNLKVKVLSLRDSRELTVDAASAAAAFVASGGLVEEIPLAGASQLGAALSAANPGVIVDAILGTGVRGAVVDGLAELISTLNLWTEQREVPVVAIDLPSGVNTDSGLVAGEVVQATATVALQALKPAHVLLPAAGFAGNIAVADIGIATMTQAFRESQRSLVTLRDLVGWLSAHPLYSATSHKGTRGHVLVVGGSEGKYGAAKLAAEAALRSGAGLVTLALPANAAATLAPELRELMCEGLPEKQGLLQLESKEQLLRLLTGKDVLLVGPGLGQAEQVETSLRLLLEVGRDAGVKIVLDADALNILALDDSLRELLSGASVVLTPHPGEMSRLLGISTEEVQADRFAAAEAAAAKYRSVVVLKGAGSIVATTEGILRVSPISHPGLGTAGSGDVLGGVISALLASLNAGSQLTIDEVTALAVLSHGLAAMMLEQSGNGRFGIVASDILGAIPEVLNRLTQIGEISPPGIFEPAIPGAFEELF